MLEVSVRRVVMSGLATALLLLGLAGCAEAGSPQPSEGAAVEASETAAPPTSAAPTPARTTWTHEDLLTAEVPELCDYPAGQLEGGVLPGIEPGRVRLLSTLSSEIADAEVFPTSGPIGAAAFVDCDHGGVAWGARVVVWDTELKPLHAESLNRLDGVGGDRSTAAFLEMDGDDLRVAWNTSGPEAPGCCNTFSAEATLSATGGPASWSPVTVYTGSDFVNEMIRAILAGEDVSDRASEGARSSIRHNFTSGIWKPFTWTCDYSIYEAAVERQGIPVSCHAYEAAGTVIRTGWNEWYLQSMGSA